MFRPFSMDTYRRNSEKVRGDDQPCAHCGRAIKRPWPFMVEVVDGGADYVRETTRDVEALRTDQASYMGCYPVGSDCAKTLRADGVVVLDQSEASSGTTHFPIGARIRLARTDGLRNRLVLRRAGHTGIVGTEPRYDGCVFVEFDAPRDHFPNDWHFWLHPSRLDAIDS